MLTKVKMHVCDFINAEICYLMEDNKMKTGTTSLLIVVLIMIAPTFGLAQLKIGSGEIKGYMVGEYYYFASHHTGKSEGGVEGRHGFWFRRIYFTYNNQLSDTVKMRFRLEAASIASLFESAALVPVVKDAYLNWRFAANTNLIAGIQSPPSFAQVEDIWGYRALEKTPLDLYRWTSSRDFGISVKGGKNVVFHTMYANGSSNKNETDNGKKVYGSIGYKADGFFAEAMTQYDKAKGIHDNFIAQAFASYQGDWGRVGLQFSHDIYKEKDADEALKYNILSAFVIYKPNEKIDLIGRCDLNFGEGWKQRFKGPNVPYVPFASNHEFSFFIAALSWQAHKNIWIIPNLKFAIYSENELLKDNLDYQKPGNDVYTNLTLWFKF